MSEEPPKPTGYKFKACPFRTGHYCGACELLVPGIDCCVFKCINANLGTLARAMKVAKGSKEDFEKELKK